MSIRTQKILAPIIVLIAIIGLWEGLVTLFQIEQFLLPKPSAIVENLVKLDIVEANGAGVVVLDETEALLDFQLGNQRWILSRGEALRPILQASWFTLKEALGGLSIGVIGGVAVALATVRWTAMREALLPFAIAANSMPIIAFAPIMNNWFGIDNPFSKMAIVAIMVFFPMMINTVRGLVGVDAGSLELMRSYALSMIGAIVGEYFGGPRIALGVFITQEASLFRFDSAWAAIIMACLMGITLYVIIVVLERLAMPWHISFREEGN